MTALTNVPAEITQALSDHCDRIALQDRSITFTYGTLARFITQLKPLIPISTPVAVFGTPSAIFGATATACVVAGRPFVHLDPAMPTEVLRNILDELAVDTIFCTDPVADEKLSKRCQCIDISAILLNMPHDTPVKIDPAQIADDDIIYIVATSGTTGKPKCIPVTQISAFLSYQWRDAYTPYTPGDKIGAYIFAIWEMFRPLRKGAGVQFAKFSELMNPKDLVLFWQRTGVMEMLFTPSALEKALLALPAVPIKNLSLQRIILNGEVVSNDLISAVRQRLPDVTLLNLYSICETHDISMTDVTHRQPTEGQVSVGVPMPHLRAVVLDDYDQVTATGQPGLLHFEGPDMLGPGYINRPNETALRFRNLTIDGRDVRLYDTGDQGFVDADGAIYVVGRVAHMLKLRGHSIQTRELTQSLHDYLDFAQAVPWVADIAGQGKTLVVYYSCDERDAKRNAQRWGIAGQQTRTPRALADAMRADLPSYCIPGYLVQLDEIPINTVSGKCDYKRLPDITVAEVNMSNDGIIPTLVEAAATMGCAAQELDSELSFHAQGGDSLMAVTFLLALEKIYDRPVDFDFALNVPLGRLHELLSTDAANRENKGVFTQKGILLTGATGFLGRRVLAEAARVLPPDQVIYCVVRERRNDPSDRLRTVANDQGVDPDKLVLISASIEDVRFGLDAPSYTSLASCVTSVVHCAAMVNLAIDHSYTQTWSQSGIANILTFCADAQADLRFTSSSAVFPDVGGPHPETATDQFDGCSGYGAAKIDAEAQIIASGVTSAIIRLPSLYDLSAPNQKDIYEIIMTACRKCNAVPEGFTFRMVDAHQAARFIVGLTAQKGVSFYNFGSDELLTSDMIPNAFDVLAPDVWIETAPLTHAERALIASDKTVLHANSRFTHRAARSAWEAATATAFTSISDPAALVAARFTSSWQRSP